MPPKEVKDTVKKSGRGRKSKEDAASLQFEQDCINAFTRRVLKEKAGNYRPLKRGIDGKFIYPHASGVTTNRGNKSLQGSESISRNRLDTSRPLEEEKVFYNGSEHRLLQSTRKRMKFPTIPQSESVLQTLPTDDPLEEDFDEINNSSKLVNVRELLTPISSLADICKRDSIKRTFNRTILKDLASNCILMIEKEQNSVTTYSQLSDVFLGDYPTPIYEKTLRLPKYDHSLTLKEEDLEDGSQLELINSDTRNANDKDKQARVTMFTRKIPTHTYYDLSEESKTQQDDKTDDEIAEEDSDPFFAVPNLALPESYQKLLPETASPRVLEEVENARQLVQIALQRNQEFIRNLQKIRGCIVKCNRIRERITSWSREYASIPEEGVTVPNALRAAKRGIISATTNRSMSVDEGVRDGQGDKEDEE